MAWIDPISLAQIHREVYVSILKSWLPHGQRGSFARKLGITREYLSYLCALDEPGEEKSQKRLPSPKLAEQIAAALPAPSEVKQSLLENMALAHLHAAKASLIVKEYIAERQVQQLLNELGTAHRQAVFGTDLVSVRHAYYTLQDAASSLLNRLSPELYPASFAQTCLYLHDVHCALDRADEALLVAKYARWVLENIDMFELEFSREQIDDMEINAIRGEAVASHNLGLDREALKIYSSAQHTRAYRRRYDFWMPFVGRDMLNAMVNVPRFSIRTANRIAAELERASERRGDELSLFLGRESWMRCLIKQGKLKKVERIYREENDRLEHLSVGALHRVLFLKSAAQLSWQKGDLAEWRSQIRDALLILDSSGLSHQLRLVKSIYGKRLEPVLEELQLQ